MPPPLSRIRRHLGRVLAASGSGTVIRVEGRGAQCLVEVPITVRAQTADGAEIRLLLDARLTSHQLSGEETERVALGLVVPAAARWVKARDLSDVSRAPEAGLMETVEAVRGQAAALGAELVSLELVASEHLILSPSMEVMDGPD